MSVVSVFYYVRVLVPVWSAAPALPRLTAPVSGTFAIVLSGVASVVLGLYPTALLIAGQIGANPISPR
jgi:NADH:ubiquinone oxidoreductase subunit 2 (subunit N)